MNVQLIEEQVLPYLTKLAESPPVQAEIETAKTAIISIIESQSLSIFQRIVRWLKNKLFKRGNEKMANVTISTIVGATISYSVNGVPATPTADSAGKVIIEGLPAGSYTFTASLTGYTNVSKTVVLVDGDSQIISLPLTATAVTTAEQTVASAIETASTSTTTTVTEDWKTIKAAAETALSGLSTSVAGADLSSNTVLTSIYSQITTVIQTAITKVNNYKSQLMISRHSKNFWECVLIDAKLAGITVFEYFVSKEINKIKSEIEAKISAL
jgi:hypothetical protein